MTMQLSMLLTAETKQAQSALSSVRDQLESVGDKARDVGTRGKAGTTALGDGAKQAKPSVDALTTALQQQIDKLVVMDSTTKSARASAEAFEQQTAANAAQFDALRFSIDPVYRASKQYEAAVEQTNAAVRAGAVSQAEANRVLAIAESQYLATGRSSQMLGQQTNFASGQLANITSQFNDIGVMLAAGQNPLQLALQQGTQLNQVFAQMGSGKQVLQGLGQAALGLVNPISLATLAVIAGGAAIIQWFTSAGEEALSFEDRVSDLSARIDDYRATIDRAIAPTDELAASFGLAADKARDFFSVQGELERAAAMQALRETVQALASDLDVLNERQKANLNSDLKGNQFPELLRLKEEFGLTKEQAFALDHAIEELGRAEGPQATIEAASALNTLLLETYGTAEKIPGKFTSLASALGEVVAASGRIADADAMQVRAMQASWTEYYSSRVTGEQQVASLKQQELSRQAAIYELYARTRSESDASAGSGAAMVAQLNEEAAIRSAILRYGEDSIQVAELRVSAERRAFTELLASMEVSESLKAELLAAWNAANGLAGTSMAGTIGAAADEAARLAGELGISLQLASALAQARHVAARTNAVNHNGLDPEDPRNPNNTRGTVWDSGYGTVSPFDPSRLPRTPRASRRGGGGRGSGSGAKAQADEVDQLIKRLKDELAVMREVDPLQKELLRNREALTDATEGERKTVSDLIQQRIAETAALEAQEEVWGLFSSTASNALDALIVQGESLSDVLKKVVANLIDATIEAASLGTGPLAFLFGGTPENGRGGWIGAIFGALSGNVAKKADGGIIYGAGHGTSDSVPILASSGEFVVNAAATARHRPLVEAINAGSPLPRYATGGEIGAGGVRRGSAAASDAMANISIDVRGAKGNSEVERAVAEGIRIGLDEFSRHVLPGRVQQINANPRMMG
jgi:hypothetical protein